MSHLDQRLRDHLLDRAAEITPKPLVVADLYGVARRRSIGKATGAFLAVVAVALSGTILATQMMRPAPSLPASAADGPFLGWPILASASVSTLIDASTAQWDADTGTRHTAVRALAAMNDTILGPIVVLEGYDAGGEPRLAILTGQPRDRTSEQKLVLRADRLAPDPQDTKVISLVTGRVGPARASLPSAASATFVIALAAPGADKVRAQSSAVDEAMGGIEAQGRFLLRALPPNATAVNTRVQLVKDDTVVAEHWSGLDSGTGDPQLLSAEVRSGDPSGHRLTLASKEAGNPSDLIGHLVISYDGVVGKVVEASSSQIIVETITSPGFSTSVQTNLSGHHGTASGNGTKLVLSGFDADSIVENGNRVVLSGAAFTGAELATIGFTTGSCRGVSCDGLTLSPAVKADGLKTVYVLR